MIKPLTTIRSSVETEPTIEPKHQIIAKSILKPYPYNNHGTDPDIRSTSVSVTIITQSSIRPSEAQTLLADLNCVFLLYWCQNKVATKAISQLCNQSKSPMTGKYCTVKPVYVLRPHPFIHAHTATTNCTDGPLVCASDWRFQLNHGIHS